MTPRIAISLDVEEWYQVDTRRIPPSTWGAQPRRVEVGIERALEILARHGSKATFFFVGEVARRVPGLVREVVRQGHEVGCHGFRHERVTRMGRDEFREDLARGRDAVGEAAGTAPQGYRAPCFSIGREQGWALEAIREAGFVYDSSLFPTQPRIYARVPMPPRPLVLDPYGLVEYPLLVLPFAGLRLPVAGGFYLRVCPEAWGWRGVERAVRDGAVGCLYGHTWEIDPDQHLLDVGWLYNFLYAYNLPTFARKFEGVLERIEGIPLARAIAEAEALPRMRWRASA